jgi:nucleotide-binding universal stress UspA family protein
MNKFDIKKILVPTDFSETGYLALQQAALMAGLFKAELLLLHVIEISRTTYNIYNPAAQVRHISELCNAVSGRLEDLARAIRKDAGIPITTLVAEGRVSHEIVNAVRENHIDIVVMGTNGAEGLGEYFVGSNAERTARLAPCPVITIQHNMAKSGFSNIILPIDNALHSRQKVSYAIALAKKYAAVVHIVGLLAKQEGTEERKLQLKLEPIEKALREAGVPSRSIIIHGKNLALEAMHYAKKEKGDLVLLLTDHESRLTNTPFRNFAKHIINHAELPVMSIHPEEGEYESVSLSAAEPF